MGVLSRAFGGDVRPKEVVAGGPRLCKMVSTAAAALHTYWIPCLVHKVPCITSASRRNSPDHD